MDKEVDEIRMTEYPTASLFRDRWSPRAMSGEPVKRTKLMSLFEAARWAPSAHNSQPWRFLFALRDTPPWEGFFGLLGEFNRSWAGNAGALVVVAAKTTFEDGGFSITHAFDTGAAWQNFALQGSLKGLVVHGMQGFDHERAKQELRLPADHVVLAMAAVGHPGEKSSLPPHLQDQEVPSDRKPLSEWVHEGPLD